jgi:hypothetical protein
VNSKHLAAAEEHPSDFEWIASRYYAQSRALWSQNLQKNAKNQSIQFNPLLFPFASFCSKSSLSQLGEPRQIFTEDR